MHAAEDIEIAAGPRKGVFRRDCLLIAARFNLVVIEVHQQLVDWQDLLSMDSHQSTRTTAALTSEQVTDMEARRPRSY